jgi:hypothetical protein
MSARNIIATPLTSNAGISPQPEMPRNPWFSHIEGGPLEVRELRASMMNGSLSRGVADCDRLKPVLLFAGASMTTAKLRKEIKKIIDHLPPKRLLSLADYVHCLERPSLTERLKKSEKEDSEKTIAAGRGTPWRRVRADV